jgi:hypothetical protein
VAGGGSPRGRGGGTRGTVGADIVGCARPRRVLVSKLSRENGVGENTDSVITAGCSFGSANGERDRRGVGVEQSPESEGCVKGFSGVMGSKTEGLGECPTIAAVCRSCWSMSSRGTPYPSRVASTNSRDLRAR